MEKYAQNKLQTTLGQRADQFSCCLNKELTLAVKTKHKAASRYSFISKACCETSSDKERSNGWWTDLSNLVTQER